MKVAGAWQDGLDAGFDALREAERRVFGGVPGPRAFRRVGRWIVAEEALADLSHSTGVLRGIFQGTSPFFVRFLSRRIMLQSRAAAILPKSNLRAFYPNDGVTMKIANPHRNHARSRLQNEIVRRRELHGTARVTLPKLMVKANDGPADFIVEEMVDAHPLTGDELQPGPLAERLIEFQLANALRMVDAREMFDPEKSLQRLGDWLREQHMAGNDRLLERLVHLVGNARTPLPVAVTLCNNDLTASNLLSSGETLYIVDWEYAGPAPCFVDAVRLATQIEGYAQAYQDAYEKQVAAAGHSGLSPRDQFLISALLVCSQRIERRSDFPSGEDRVAYDKRLKKRIVRFLRVMHGLAS